MRFIKIFKVQYYKLDKDNTQSNLCVFEISPGGPSCLWVSYLQIQHTVDQKEKKKKGGEKTNTKHQHYICTAHVIFISLSLFLMEYNTAIIYIAFILH